MSTPLASRMFAEQTVAPAMTDDQIAVAMGISKSLVFQLRMRAMAKIREAVLNDDDLRDATEEIVGRRLPPRSAARELIADRPATSGLSDSSGPSIRYAAAAVQRLSRQDERKSATGEGQGAENPMSISITTPVIQTQLFDSAKLGQLAWLWADDRRLEKLFDWFVEHGRGPDTAAILAELHEQELQRSHG
jgi:hypothetical protein